jgi:cyclophilin family peptidyl-prolyl cis-trans isomerase
MLMCRLCAIVLCCACLVTTMRADEPPAAEKAKPAEAAADKPVDKPATEKAADKPAAEKPAALSPTPAARFAEANRQWQALDKRLKELEQSYNTTPSPAARAEIKKQFQELVDQSGKLLPELQSLAEVAYIAAPNKDPDVTRVLVGLLAYKFRSDEYEAALKLAKLLEDHECNMPELDWFGGMAAFNADDYETAERRLSKADKAGRLDRQGKSMLAELPEQKKAWAAEQDIRKKEAAAEDLPRVKLETSKGPIVIELFENEAPQTVGNFVSLVEAKKYDGLSFHRVLPGFMAQGGDPAGDGSGGPGYTIYCECDKPEYRRHFRGTLSMAHAGKNTGGSQFFLTFRPTTHLNGLHTAFGRVVEGLDVLAKLQRIDPESPTGAKPDTIVKAEVLRKRDHAYEPTKVK